MATVVYGYPMEAEGKEWNDKWRRIRDELYGGSERSLAIVGLALVDNAVKTTLQLFMVDRKESDREYFRSCGLYDRQRPILPVCSRKRKSLYRA